MNATPQSALHATELAVLQHVELYGLTVAEAVRTITQRRSLRAASRLLCGLEQQGMLRCVSLYGQRRCFVLTHRGIDELRSDTPKSRMERPLSEQTKLRQFATLSFCCLGKAIRQKVAKNALTRVGSDSNRTPSNNSYYVEIRDNGKQRFGFLRVDAGRHGRWDRILAKVRQDAYGHAANPAFHTLIGRGDFEVTVTTALPQKAARLCRSLLNEADSLPVPVRVTSIPDVLYLIAPPPR